MTSSTWAAFRVATSGRKWPVASAKPATAPETSAAGTSETAVTTPEVPSETTTSPGAAPSPSAAPALSPHPGPSTQSAPAAVPTTSSGAATRGVRAGCPRARLSRSGRYSPEAADQ